MTTAVEDTVGRIVDHYSDVIEGGSSYAGVSSHIGIPGTHSRERDLLPPLQLGIEAAATVDSETVQPIAALDRWTNDFWVRADAPPFFLAASIAKSPFAPGPNKGLARRVTAYEESPAAFVVDAFPDTIRSGDVFEVREGFKRVPNGFDINDDTDGVPSGFDRFFDILLMPGGELDLYGMGKATCRTTLELRLRLVKWSRSIDAKKSALENASIIRNVITRPDMRDSTYVRALLPGESPQIAVEDKHKVIVSIPLTLIYRINTEFT